MSDFIAALQAKIVDLEKEKSHVDDKIELLNELLEAELRCEDQTSHPTPSPKKRRAGRPRGSRNKKSSKGKKDSSSKHAVKDDLYDEAMTQVERLDGGGTSVELQQSRTRNFNPIPRAVTRTDSNVHAGTKQEVDAARQGSANADATISVNDDEDDRGAE